MIDVSFERDKENGYISLRVKGHAGQAKRGHDIVCSAASILAYTVAQYLRYVHQQGGLAKKPRIILDEGNALIVAKPTQAFEGEVLNAFFVAEVGYNLLAQNYPQYLGIKLFGEAE